ncbi:hypothetical protein BQ8482_110061 [Mesorhizobium delmotii]|uniref:Uncharacterized protein n=1 Tax=Mesorhizobium delmotii TaxID=1631247 RepID=A0A2P9AAH6_9HYPH|nr:hypothetical protein BQ8482_110061 [Mesorhizobium delmotii]
MAGRRLSRFPWLALLDERHHARNRAGEERQGRAGVELYCRPRRYARQSKDNDLLSRHHADHRRSEDDHTRRLRHPRGAHARRAPGGAGALSGAGGQSARVPEVAARAEGAEPHRRRFHGRRGGCDRRPAIGHFWPRLKCFSGRRCFQHATHSDIFKRQTILRGRRLYPAWSRLSCLTLARLTLARLTLGSETNEQARHHRACAGPRPHLQFDHRDDRRHAAGAARQVRQ